MRKRLGELNWQPLNTGNSEKVLEVFDSKTAEVGARPSVSVKGQKEEKIA
jgi:hypothetical protein